MIIYSLFGLLFTGFISMVSAESLEGPSVIVTVSIALGLLAPGAIIGILLAGSVPTSACLDDLVISDIRSEGGVVVVEAAVASGTARCPGCGTVSRLPSIRKLSSRPTHEVVAGPNHQPVVFVSGLVIGVVPNQRKGHQYVWLLAER
jgi:hypothetical protein